jgi:hypothetical protein
VLHVLNGDAARSVFEAAGLVGNVLVWRDILVEGPVTTGDDAVPMLNARVEFLSERLAIERERYARSAHEEAAALETARAHDEVVLWFEQDLFCAVNLWRLLDWFGRRPPMPRLSLVYPSIDEIKGLGALDSRALAARFAARVAVTNEMLALGRRAWAAYASADPLDGASLVDCEDDALPFVRNAFRCHLGRFPSVANGLNELEAATLAGLRRGPRNVDELFREVSTHPRVRRHGMGDVQFAATVRCLAPLVRAEARALSITEVGRDVIGGDADWLTVRPIDTWLGGVRLVEGRPLWRWDGARGRLMSTPA